MPSVSRPVSRRNVLRALGGAAMVGLAGCSRSEADPVSPTDIGGGEPGSVFQSLSFDLGDLVIGLPEDHGVSQISLVEPDGTVFTSVSPDFAATTVRMAIADPEVGRTGYTHYKPGAHELVAKLEEQTERRSLALHPDLSITDIKLYRTGDRPIDLGRVVVGIRNEGTAPTWPYDITFEGAPDWTVNDPLSEPLGIPMDGALQADELVIPPGGERWFVSQSAPLLYDEEGPIDCDGESVEFRVIVGTMLNSPLSQTVQITTLGDREPATLGGRYICNDSKMEILDG